MDGEAGWWTTCGNIGLPPLARVMGVGRQQQLRRGSISSALQMCGGGVRSILLLPLVARCLETIDVCIWHMFVFMSVVVTVWRSVGMIDV